MNDKCCKCCGVKDMKEMIPFMPMVCHCDKDENGESIKPIYFKLGESNQEK